MADTTQQNLSLLDKTKLAVSSVWQGLVKWYTNPGDVAVDTTVQSSAKAAVIGENIGTAVGGAMSGFINPIIVPLVLIALVFLMAIFLLNKVGR